MATRTILEHELAYFAKMSYGDLFRRHAFAYPLQTPKKRIRFFLYQIKIRKLKWQSVKNVVKGLDLATMLATHKTKPNESLRPTFRKHRFM